MYDAWCLCECIQDLDGLCLWTVCCCVLFFLFFLFILFFFFSSRRRHTRSLCDWSSDVALPISRLQYPDATKSSTKDLTRPLHKMTIARLSIATARHMQYTYFSQLARVVLQRCLTSLDSDLEAFSRYPAVGSFAALAVQLTAFAN